MITVVGSVNLDLTGIVNHFPKPGETITCTSFRSSPGGKGANQALAARRSGSGVSLIGAVGEDGAATVAMELLEEAGVDLKQVQRKKSHTGQAMILINAAGENVIAVAPGANLHLDSDSVRRLIPKIPHSQILLLQQEISPDVIDAALEAARRAGQTTILNTAPHSDSYTFLSSKADIVIANEGEFQNIARIASVTMDAVRSWTRERQQTVIVTMGGAGAIVADAAGVFSVPAPEVKVVSTVGAGDTFCGYFASGLDLGFSIKDAVVRAVRAASKSCLLMDAQPSIPWARDL